MCISTFIKYMLLSVAVGTLIIFAVFYDRIFYFISAMVFAIIWSRIRCPKCRTCGHDTMICDEGK